MEDRLQWIRLEPRTWVDWEPVRGGLAAHALLERRYPRAQCFIYESRSKHAQAALDQLARPWWRRLSSPAPRYGPVPEASAQMLWANMALHTAADPQSLLQAWHRALAVGGFLMFSCLGPDTLRELRAMYRALGWPPPAHEFTDMHDWGDMLGAAGFAEPVMDMERITLTWETPGRLIEELRELGANLHSERFGALRGRAWRERLERQLGQTLKSGDGRLALTFEIIYGHAMKPKPMVRLSSQSSVSIEDMRSMLHSKRWAGD
jgi:malonyl-CoA O-methyltransferase